MHRFFIPPEWISQDRVAIQGPLVHQLRDVLRLQPNDRITILDNTGWEYEALESLSSSVDASDYVYNFVGSDGWSILVNKLGGDASGLPTYEQLDRGRIIEYDDDGDGDVRVRWDLGLNFPSYMGARMMNGGKIEMIEP